MECKNKLQEEITKADNKVVEKMWKNIDEDCTLKAFLEKMTKDELVKIAKKYSVRGITTLKKADAVEKMVTVILENTKIALELMEENSLKYIEELTKITGLKKYECTDMMYINYLRNRGLAFSGLKNDEAFVVMPKELKSIISEQLNKELKDKARLNEEVIKAISGMVYYYGVCKFDFIISNVKNIFGTSLEEEYIKALITNGEELGYDYVIDGDMLCNIDVEDAEKILKLQEECKNNYYKFDKKSLIKAGKVDFVEENKQRTKLERVLGELFVIDKNILKEEMEGFMIAIKNEVEKEARDRRNELQRNERRLLQKEDALDRKVESYEKKEEQMSQKLEELEKQKEDVKQLQQKQLQELERISGLTLEEAKNYILESVQNEVKHEATIMIKEMESKAKLEADRRSREIVANAIQKCAVDHVAETTVSVVQLPNDEMKGRIIGREGRNIRALETLTGIDLIIDDTPEAVILSGFDPIRREIARIALEKLIVDGRVHPSRIEEMVEKAKKEVDVIIREEGEAATFETGVNGLHPELIRLLGKLKYRTSYGQNVLKHSVEVAHLTGLMASELGLDANAAKRAGLLHDIGKSVDHEMEGSHVSIGVGLCKKYKESALIINAVEAHHGDVEPQSIIAVLVQAADAISAARPGARRETLESYIKRLEKLEEIADNFKGVEKSFAIQAGRELRIVIVPEDVGDDDMTLLARDIAKKIEEELEYPGQIKVNLIRETRAVEYAK